MPDNRIALDAALAYFRPPNLSRDCASIVMTVGKMREHLAVIEVALRADHDAGGAVAMREAAAKACDTRARMTFSAPTRIAAEDLAAEIRALPLASKKGSRC